MIKRNISAFSQSSRWLLVLVALTLVFSMAACADSNFPKAEESVNGFFKALSEADLETARTYCISDSDNFKFTDPQEEKMIKLIVQKAKHEIVSSTEDGNTATVKVKVTNLDMEKIFEDVMTNLMGEVFDATLEGKEYSDEETTELTLKYLEESMSKPDAPVVTNELDVTLNKDTGKKIWVIRDDDAFVSGITGNLDGVLDE